MTSPESSPPPVPESAQAPDALAPPDGAPSERAAGDESAAPEPPADAEAPSAGEAESAGAPAEAAPEPVQITVDAAEWQALQEAQGQLEDRLLRAQAEFENYRKRIARERSQTRDAAIEETTRQFLPVVDNLDRAVAAAEQALDEQHLEGWRLIHRQLYDVLRSFGVRAMAVLGERFDPRYHEAVAETPHADIAAGHVAAEVERGYLIGDRVLRTAKVAVSSGPPVAAEPD